MHAAANVLPMPSAGPSLGDKWIKANTLVAITFPLTTSLLPFVLNKAFSGMSATVFSWGNAALAFFVVVVNVAVYAILTGSVLSQKLPAFSRRTWIAAHLAFGSAFGLIMAIANFGPDGGGGSSPTGQYDTVNFLIGAFVVLPIVGVLLGGLQALVLRRAARGMLAWTAGFAIAFTTVFVLGPMVVGTALISFQSQVMTSIAANILSAAMVMLMALIMLPAFNRLTPKN